MPLLQIIIASTRPGRVGDKFAYWFADLAGSQGAFEVEVVDLAKVALPFFDEPKHPRLGEYENQHTKDWSASVARADAFVFVTPEYNHGYPATLKNAIDYLSREWQGKAVGFVSYGGAAGGTRAVEQLKQVVNAVGMTAVADSVVIANFTQVLDSDGGVAPSEVMQSSATLVLDELSRITTLMRPPDAASRGVVQPGPNGS